MNNRHPLDPLTKDEINQACAILKAKYSLQSHHRFIYVMNDEPTPQDIAINSNDSLPRIVFICVLDSIKNETYESRVNLSANSVIRWKKLPFDKRPYGQAPILAEEADSCDAILKSDPEWRAAMKRRDLTDKEIDLLQVDSFSAGYVKDAAGKRLTITSAYYREKLTDNGYARPVEGVIATIDLTQKKIIKLEDDGKNTPIPKAIHNYDSESIKDKLPPLKPIVITQPEGPGFTIDGWKVSWHGWKLRLGFTQREGLVLHDVSINDKGLDRPVMQRGSVTEMVVPYADPSPNHFFKAAFDAGENGFGRFANHLELGCDCKGHIKYFDVPAADANGNAFVMKNAICMHEEDAGIAWKQYEHRTGVYETRRARKLVISFATSIDNYTYIFYWNLFLDGRITLKAALTGIVQTAATVPNAAYKWGAKLTPELAAPMHQHLFNVRLQMSVDGPNNSVSQTEFCKHPISEENTGGIAFGTKEVIFKTESKAKSRSKASAERSWKVFNPNHINAIGEPTAYKIDVPQSPLLLADKQSRIYKRATFATRNIWVTQYDPTQKYASGDYPNQHAGGSGLPKYIKKDRSIVNTPLTIWVTSGTTHKSRTEDFPAMPVKKLKLVEMTPFGFFDHNPVMGLQPEVDEKSVKHMEENFDCCGTSKKSH